MFRYDSAEAVMDHLLKSGAGTVIYDAVAPEKRKNLRAKFLDEIRMQNKFRKF